MLRADNLTYRHGGRVVLDALDLQVDSREIVALVGPDAAEKTAAIECFLGLRVADAGCVCVAGFDVADEPSSAAANLAVVPARLALPDRVNGLRYAGAVCAERGQHLSDAVLRAGLLRAGIPPEWHARQIAGYSPALRRQLAFAVATLKNTPVLIFDDPTADLVGADLDHFVASLRRLRKRGKAILLATRDFDFARRLATRIVVMENGAMVELLDPNASRQTFNAASYLAELVG